MIALNYQGNSDDVYVDDGDRFYRAHLEAFIKSSNEDTTVVAALAAVLEAKFNDSWLNQAVWRVLDIGGGPGTKTFALLRRLQKFVPKIELVNVDPCKEWHAEYLAEAKAAHLETTFIEMHAVRWEEFRPEGRFDFVLCSHSIYGIRYLGDQRSNQNPLSKMLDVLTTDGIACIVVQSTRNLVYKVQEAFRTTTEGRHFPLCSGAAIVDALNHMGLPPRTTQRVLKYLDICCLGRTRPDTNRVRDAIMSLMLALPRGQYALMQKAQRTQLENILLSAGRISDSMQFEECHSLDSHKVVPIEDDFIWCARAQ